MSITQAELADRIRRARKAAGLTQEDLGMALGLSRPAVAQMEAGNRRVDSLELSRIARALGRSVGDFLAPEFHEDGVAIVLRSLSDVCKDASAQKELSRALAIAREIVALTGILGLERVQPSLPNYRLQAPKSKWDAVVQGNRLACDERRRLELGTDPIGDLAGLMEGQGVLVLELNLPEVVSGFTFVFGGNLACAVNVNDVPGRQRYSLAHELCHAVCDIGAAREGIVSQRDGTKSLTETRADVFAAAFLVPDEGLRKVLEGLGKGHPGIVRSEEGRIRSREPARTIDPWDVVHLARYFGVTVDALAWRLVSVGFISKEEREELVAQARAFTGLRLGHRLDPEARRAGDVGEEGEPAPLRRAETRLFGLSFEALRREEISRRKFVELAELAGLTEDEIDELPQARRVYQ